MLLESLFVLVEKLRGRIETHGDLLRQREAVTRYALIDPLLRELGWDTEDPEVVRPEFPVDIYGGNWASADYALMNMSTGKPLLLIESKKLDESLLGGNAVQQGIQGCVNTATDFFAVTNGRKWEIYDTRRRVPPPEMKVVEFDLTNDSVAEVCLKALALWRHGAVAGSVSHAQAPITGLMGDVSTGAAQSTDAMSAAGSAPVVAQPTPTISVPQESPAPEQSDANDGWQSLSGLRPPNSDVKPTQMMFPDESEVTINYWTDVTAEAVQWLTSNGHLDESHCPIPRTSTRHLVNTQPIHPDGKDFFRAREVNSLYIEMEGWDVSTRVRNTRTIIEHVGLDASQFKLRW